MNEKSIFEEYTAVECGECEMYYTNRCDGADIPTKGSDSSCKSFIPIRNVTIPKDIEKLKDDVEWLYAMWFVLFIFWLAMLVIVFLVK